MLPVRTVLIAALPLLVMSSGIQQCSLQNSTHLLNSLQCNNDYTTHIRCTWEEDPHTLLPLVITRRESFACISNSHDVLLPNGKLLRSCVYKTKDFNWEPRTVFFNSSCPSSTTKLNIAQQGKVLSPVNVSEREVDGGGRKLSWSSPYSPSSPLSHTLIYQVKYRRHGHDWTVVDNTTATHQVIEKEELLPGHLYEARVRARGRSGLWSDWSPSVFWIIKEEGPFNLQCLIEEWGVSCSWRVRTEHIQALSYHLCWETSGSIQACQICPNYTKRSDHAVLDFTCSVVTSEPEQLTIELKSVRISKTFEDGSNIQPPRPVHLQIMKEDGEWKLTWSKPKFTAKFNLKYELQFYSNNTRDYKQYNTSGLSLHVPSHYLLPATTYVARVRALITKSNSGQPSDWSEPVFFENDAASWTATIMYILTGVFVVMFFFILYNTLPVCHRRVVLWKVSIPSPIKSRVLKEMSSKRSPSGWNNVYCESEKTSVCIMQSSDNPIIFKGSISECPPLPYSDDSLAKLDWADMSDLSSSYIEGSGMSVKSAVSFTGPYILCSQESSLETETLDTSFYSLSTFDDDSRSITEITSDSPSANGGYVSSPPTSLTCTQRSVPSDNSVNKIQRPSLTQLPVDDPPAYTRNPTAMPGALFSHPSGYFLMPSVEMDVAAWMQASATPPGGNTERQTSNAGEREQSACGYVTLSQPAV